MKVAAVSSTCMDVNLRWKVLNSHAYTSYVIKWEGLGNAKLLAESKT